MTLLQGRRVASVLRLRAPGVRRLVLPLLCVLLMPLAGGAVVVRGRVTDALGRAVPGARVQLIVKGKVEAIAYADAKGAYEIRSTESGRFTLLGSAGGFLPAIGQEFYGGAVDVVSQDVVLSATTVKQEVSVTATGIPTPLQQLTAPVALIQQNRLATRVGVVSELRQIPGLDVVQTGQSGAVTSLFVRGGPSDGNKVLIDGIPAEDVGGVFDYGTVSSTGIGSVEVYRDPNSALYGSDSQAAVVSIATPRGTTEQPLLTYSGDAGTLHTWRNEVTLGGTVHKLDYFAGYSRFDTSNALPYDRHHSSTTAANVGYDVIDGLSLRFTFRDGVSAQGLPNAYDFYNVTQDGKEGDQDLYSGLTLDYRTKSDWHNLVRYGIARKREQANYFGNQGTLTTINDPVYGPFPAYVGNVVRIRGANGYTATGQAQFFSTDRDQDSNRDELYYQSDYTFPKHISALFGFRYDNERGSYNSPGPYGEHEQLQRTNFEWDAQFQGDIKGRFFYSVGGSLQKNHLYGYAGEPRFGVAVVPVRPGNGLLHGTKLRANLATGVQEPSLATEFESLYRQLEENGDTTDIQLFHIQPLGPERSRSADVGLDQNIWRQTLVMQVDYFHNQFSHQLEDVGSQDLETYFGFAPTDPNVFLYGAELNSMAYRAQGAEVALTWQPKHHLFVRGGYTYLDAVVLQSFTGDVTAAMQGMPTENPNLPGIAIGGVSPLVGARPFRRPPHTGFFSVNYTRNRFSATLDGALASRADDSTYLTGLDTVDGNSLLLPNRDLDFGYVKLDLGGTYALKHGFTAFAQMDNLLNDQHIGPIGYPGLPLTARVGIKLRLGGD
ncbi:MAG TPA: TonB-dependent receptor [Acidobacteriaceae bacterium]|jgi:iron complex outermembrane receptor protein/vitamin B12 transporter|nr:TonB-dependent receptor [Acidobacteriaceae bacterium]